MIEVKHLTKTFGDKTAVDDVTFTAEPGKVTGFLGPNGAGKSTTMRMIMGLDRPTSGTVTVSGKPYASHSCPLHRVGALLDAKAVHTSRSAYNHLHALAATHGIGRHRVNEVIEMTGLASVAKKRVGGFSLGMGQRLGIAAALIGDPETVILDEPVNGLDPEGVLWVRNLTRRLAAEGRTVFLSSHLMSEMAQTADHLIVIGRGRIIADSPMRDVLAGNSAPRHRVRADRPYALVDALAGQDVAVEVHDSGVLEIAGPTAESIAHRAMTHQVMLYEIAPLQTSLEEAYMELTKNDVEYQSLESGSKGL